MFISLHPYQLLASSLNYFCLVFWVVVVVVMGFCFVLPLGTTWSYLGRGTADRNVFIDWPMRISVRHFFD